MSAAAAFTLPAQLIDRFRVVAVERVDRLEAGWNTLLATPDAAAIANVQREIHTLKGEARTVGFADVDVVCHRLEDLFELARERAFVVSDDFDLVVTMALRFIAMLVCKRAGAALAGIDLPGFLDHIEVVMTETRRERSLGQRARRATHEHDLLDGLRPAARARLAETALAVFLEHHGRGNERMAETWRSMRELFVPPEPVAVRALLERHEHAAAEIAHALGKQVAIVIEIGADFAIAPSIVETLDVAMIHLIRNAIDHGIELADARVLAGKPATGSVTVRCWLDGETIRFTVVDDGRGIDHASIRERATALGLLDAAHSPTDAQLEALLFQPMFSTRTTATHLSGRGIGLDAVASAVALAGGTITIETRTGRGATFAVAIPYPRRRLRVRRLVVPTARLPLVVASEWVATPAAGDAIDLVAALQLSGVPATDPPVATALRRGFQEVHVFARAADELEADRIVITDPTAIAEIVAIEGKDALLVRPDRLLF